MNIVAQSMRLAEGNRIGSLSTNVKAVDPDDLGSPDHEGWRFWRLSGARLTAPYTSGGVLAWPATATARAGCRHTPNDGISASCRCGITVGPSLTGLAEYKIALWDLWAWLPDYAEQNAHFIYEDIAVGRLHTWNPAHPVRNTRWHMEHPFSSDDGQFFRVDAAQLQELWTPGNVSDRTAQAIANRHGVTVHTSTKVGAEWMRELAPDANPRRFGCWVCGEPGWPLCLPHADHRYQWLAAYRREVVREMAETNRHRP